LGFSFKDFFLECFLQRSEVSVASDSAELLLAPQQRTGTPTWSHPATSLSGRGFTGSDNGLCSGKDDF
jgi:hypothetical protein